jgi:hypothetical protein
MSDLFGDDPSAAVGNDLGDDGSRPFGGGAPASRSPGPRTPIQIMAERRAREQRKIEEARKRYAEEENARMDDEAGEERRAAAGVAGAGERNEDTGYRRPTSLGQSNPQPGERRERLSSGGGAKVGASGTQPSAYAPTGAGGRAPEPMATRRDQGNGNGAAPIPQARPRATPTSQAQPRPQTQPTGTSTYRTQPLPTQSQRAGVGTQPPPAPSVPTSQPVVDASRRNPAQSSFPHAFERWETLSSHWEGLTSYWIRKLQDNSSDINQQPLNQQMSRQITDLSAAGANLFHAVVELQRLRASSERKFQRWFFETRSEQERAKEVQGEMEGLVRRERELRAEASKAVARMEQEKSNAERMVSEMKRELQISKEEARRAWEELGRREQEERDRTLSLRDGQPTLVGGVQVVPMMAGGVSRHGSLNRPTTRDGPYPGGPTPAALGGQSEPQSQAERTQAYVESTSVPYEPSLTSTADDPFYENATAGPVRREPETSSLPSQGQRPVSNNGSSGVRPYPPVPVTQTDPAVLGSSSTSRPVIPAPTAPSQFYQHQGTSLEGDNRSFPDDNTLSDEEYEIDEQGNFPRDAQGRRIPYHRRTRSEDSDEYDVQEDIAREQALQARYGQLGGRGGINSSAPAGRGQPTYSGDYAGTDYSGAGYGPGWEAVPRHHHPTRLSDVLEEDERSRTSPSRASQDNQRR